MKKRRLLSLMLLIGLIVGVSGTLTSCKDYDDDSEWNERTANNETLIKALNEDVAALKTAQANCRNTCKNRIDSLGRVTSANTTEIINLKTDIHNLNVADSLLQKAIDAANQRIDDANALIGQVKEGVDANTDSINALRTRLADCVNNCSQTALKVEGLLTDVSELKTTVAGLDTAVKGLQNDVKNLYQKAYEDSLSADSANKLAQSADSLAKENLKKINADEVRLDNVEQRLGTVEDLAAANKQALDLLSGRVDALEALVNKIQDALKKQVTSIIVDGTYNPIFGYYAAPSGDVRSTFVGTYYGNPGTTQFPTSVAAYYSNTNSLLSTEDITITGTQPQTFGGSTIVTEDGANGNAGKLWLTLNPTEVDLTGKDFSLVNSQGTESALKLAAVAPSNELLQFGYTRAGSTGLYEAKATVSPEAVENLKPNVNVQDMKDEIRTLYHNWKNRNQNGGMQVNLSQLAGVIYENINNVLPALALKTTWSDDNSGSHTVLSQYGVGAAAVKPLSFGFLQNRTFTPLPVYTAYEDLNVHIDTVVVNNVEHLSDQDITVTITYDSYDQNGNPTTETQTVKLTQLNEMIDRINESLGGIIGQVNGQIKDADNELDRLSNLTQLFKTYDRWANRVNGWFSRGGNNDINRSLQPVLFYGAGSELHKVGNAKFGTVGLPSGTSLLATTYTLELLAPAYEKWIAVTNVWPNSADAVRGTNSAQSGNSSALNALKAANEGENMNKIVYGTTRHVTLGTLNSGYIYEISYAAVDYSGKNVVRKFYVRGK